MAQVQSVFDSRMEEKAKALPKKAIADALGQESTKISRSVSSSVSVVDDDDLDEHPTKGGKGER